MAVQQKSRAVDVALAHTQAWSNHDFDRARSMLADDVEVTATTTQPIMAATTLAGIEDYMHGLVEFAQPVAPNSLRVLAATGDEYNALLLVTVKAPFGPGGTEATLAGARLYLLDDDDKIKKEQVIFFVAEG
jgi:SnoaL-like protein